VKDKMLNQIEKFLDPVDDVSRSAFTKTLEAIERYARLRIDPWSSTKHKEKLIETVKESQIKFLSDVVGLIHQKKIAEIQKFNSEEQILNEVSNIIQNPVFVEFVKSISEPSFNWKGGSSQNTDEFYEDEAWWDKFLEIIKGYKEEWRVKLLAEVLKLKAKDNQYVGYSTLWKIVTLPPHSWEDLVEFSSIAGELWVNGRYVCRIIPGIFSKILQISYTNNSGIKRLVPELETSLSDEGLTRTETGPFILRRNDENVFILGEKRFRISTSENYEDPTISDEHMIDEEFEKNCFRLYGIWLSYMGEEILQLSYNRFISEDSFEILNKCILDAKEDGIIFEEIEKQRIKQR
jgi:hypothetical protein